MKSIINSFAFNNAWGEGDKKTYYFNVSLSGEAKPVSIGAKSMEPEWLKVNEEIEWEWFNEEKRSIKRVVPKKGGFGAGKAFVDQSTTQFIICAINNATSMKIAGAIPEGMGTEEIVRGIVELAVQLKNEYK